MENRSILTAEETAAQENYIGEIRSQNDRDAQESGRRKRAFVLTFGCQQNEADSEKLRGLAKRMGYDLTDRADDADLIAVNTCAIREHAEKRALSIVGQYKHLKEKNPNLVIAVCGCMTAQAHRCEQLKKSYPYVDIVFGTASIHRFPEFVAGRLGGGKRRFCPAEEKNAVAEGLPIERESDYRAWVSIMYGCNNFCSYCIVPYVRGRERSREPEKILEEVRQLAQEGYKEITLLGQNVNSYGKDLETPWDFADLLAAIDEIPGDYLIRFMSSQPKDASYKLFDTMARCGHVARQLHLPVQSGCDRVLRAMNRPYDKAKYLDLITYARKVMPDLVLTSDVIIGFPGETEAEAMETVARVREVEVDALFTFIFSPRPGTPAAKMDDPVPRSEKQVWFDRLCDTQNEISARLHAAYVGRTVRVLVDGTTDDSRWPLSARTNGGRLVHLAGDPSVIGTYQNVTVTDSNTWALFGELST